MKKEKRTIDLKESELLDELHQAEKEIDSYLAEKEAEADEVLLHAREEVRQQQVDISREAEEKSEEEYNRKLAHAEREAERILEEGQRLIRSELAMLEEKRGSVVSRIVDLILGKEP